MIITIDGRLFDLEQLAIALRYDAYDATDRNLRVLLLALATLIERLSETNRDCA